MSNLPRATQDAILADLLRKHELTSYMYLRSTGYLAVIYNTSKPTLLKATAGKSTRLEPEVIAAVKQAQAERKAMEPTWKAYSYAAIGRRHGVHGEIVRQYWLRYISRQSRPLSREELSQPASVWAQPRAWHETSKA